LTLTSKLDLNNMTFESEILKAQILEEIEAETRTKIAYILENIKRKAIEELEAELQVESAFAVDKAKLLVDRELSSLLK